MDYLKKMYIPIAILAALLLCAIVVIESESHKKQIIKETKSKLIAERYERKKLDIEQFFAQMYQSARTIGLLPSVRSITGGNIVDESEDVVADGRFSAEGHSTVQQLYNNLTVNVNVSEVYAILDGFSWGETPFFMYDSLIVGSNNNAHDEGADVNPDYPEESEAEEYGYYPEQIKYLKQNYPNFISTLDEIPAVTSPPMLTCDNTQYVSIKHGQPENAYGIAYSVPFYDNSGGFRGIISAIFRLNVLEALLLDVPFIIITDKDRIEAEKTNFIMPEDKGDFVLINKGYDTFVGDRRDQELIDQIKELSTSGTHDENYYSEELNIKDNKPWVLYYRYNKNALDSALSAEKSKLVMKLSVIVITTIFIVFWLYTVRKKKNELLHVAFEMRDIAEGEGDLTMRLSGTWKGEVGELVKWTNVFIDRINKMVGSIQDAGRMVTSANAQVVSASDKITGKMSEQTDKSNQVSGASAEMSKAINDIASNASTMALSALDTMKTAQNGGEVVQTAITEVNAKKEKVSDLALIVSSLGKQSQNIGAIINVINDIAEQTNLLALNAAIEAARAGEQGRGFAVVADEVRKLAEKTSQSTMEISNMIVSIQKQTSEAEKAMEESIARVESGVDYSSKAGNSLGQIVNGVTELQDMVQNIASATEEISATVEQVSNDIEEIASISQNTSIITSDMSLTTNELSKNGQKLNDEISFFKIHKESDGRTLHESNRTKTNINIDL